MPAGKLRGNWYAEPGLSHCSFQACEITRAGLGIVSNQANPAGPMGFGLDAVGIRHTPAGPHEVDASFQHWAARKC